MRKVGLFTLAASVFLVLLTGFGCKEAAPANSESSDKEIVAFFFTDAANVSLSADVVATISGTNFTAIVPSGTDVTSLVATFAATGISVTVGGVTQTSGVTLNNFSSPVVYVVHAEDGSTKSYTVTVTAAPSSEKDITAYSLIGTSGTISGTDISVSLPFSGTDATSLVASFTTTGASVRIGATVQVSGVTANNFLSPVTYTVYAEDGSTKSYVVTVALTCSLDAYEPNDSLAAPWSLGTIAEESTELSFTATITPDGDKDFYRVYAQEGSHTCFPGSAQDFNFRVRLVPPQGNYARDYDLYLYDDGWNMLGSSANSGSSQETITYHWSGICGMEDSRYFLIEVRPWGGAFTCSPYTLFLDMWSD